MTEQLKLKYINILNQCNKFSKFQKIYNLIENYFLPANKQKLLNLEDLNYCYKNKGKEQWQIIETSTKEICVVLKKFDTNYNLKIFNLFEFADKSVLQVSTNVSLDENCVALLEVHNLKKDKKYMVEIVVAKQDGKTFLVQKDWSYSLEDEKWKIECDNFQLTKNQISEIENNI